MSEAPTVNIPFPKGVSRNCTDCGQMMDAQALVNIEKGPDRVRKIMLTCHNDDCDHLSTTRKWPA